MHARAYTLPVNPPGTERPLTRADVWRGLVMKAENAVPFVPGMERCEIVERFEGGFVREIRINGRDWTERVTLSPEACVLFERLDAQGNVLGWVSNVLSRCGDDLLLTFALDVPSAGERDMKTTYTQAIAATLRATRELLLRR